MADDFNPYSAPQASGQLPVEEGSGLKSLGQEVRKTSLNKARWIMIVLGVIQIGIAIFLYFNTQGQIRDAERKGMIIDHDVVRLLWFIIAGAGAIGSAFIGMGIFIYSYPVPFTIAGLVIYAGDQLLGVVLGGPEMITKGIVFKILIIAGLWQAIQAAQAYERERRMSRYDGF